MDNIFHLVTKIMMYWQIVFLYEDFVLMKHELTKTELRKKLLLDNTY